MASVVSSVVTVSSVVGAASSVVASVVSSVVMVSSVGAAGWQLERPTTNVAESASITRVIKIFRPLRVIFFSLPSVLLLLVDCQVDHHKLATASPLSPVWIATKIQGVNLRRICRCVKGGQVGYDILKTVEFRWPVAQIVLQHQERMNGSGYPSGLSSEEIYLEARILGVADVVEAMASHRPYRSALGIDKALQEISQHRGPLYDPKVVDACLTLFNQKGFSFVD